MDANTEMSRTLKAPAIFTEPSCCIPSFLIRIFLPFNSCVGRLFFRLGSAAKDLNFRSSAIWKHICIYVPAQALLYDFYKVLIISLIGEGKRRGINVETYLISSDGNSSTQHSPDDGFRTRRSGEWALVSEKALLFLRQQFFQFKLCQGHVSRLNHSATWN